MKKYIGDRDFYARVLRVALPCALSQLLLSCNSIIDSIMVSSIGMVTAVGNATNVLNLHNYIMWGIEAGVCLFAAQFFGAKQYKNMAKTQGLCLMLCLINAAFWILAVFLFGEKILLFYLDDRRLLPYSYCYLKWVVLSFIPLSITISFKVMFQGMHKTRITFLESLCFVLTNIIIKYIFIYVLDLGIEGAGIASLLIEILCCIGFSFYSIKTKPIFLYSLKEMFDFDLEFIEVVVKTILPIALNETLFGFGQSLFNKAYGILGTNSMEAVYISNDIISLILFITWGYGEAVTILVGTNLGRGRIELAKEESKYHLGLAFVVGTVLGLSLIFGSDSILHFYNVSNINIYNLCKSLLCVYSIKAFLRTFNYVMFCTLKAGGDSKIYNLLDSGIMYTVGIPIAFICIYAGIKDIVLVVLLCQIEQLVRFVVTIKRYNSYKWTNNLTLKG